MDRSPVRDFLVGLFVLAGIVAVGYLSVSVAGFSFKQTKGLTVSAPFDETGGLAVGAPVVIGGVRVGQITGISLQDDFRARVDMDLDPKLKLPVDTSAAIVTAGVLGDRYIELTPGGDEQMLKPGDKLSFTDSAVILEKVIGQLIYGMTKSKPADNNSSTSTTQPASKP